MTITIKDHTYDFAHGGRENGYPGISVTNGTQILETIAQIMDNVGGTVTDTISSNNTLLVQTTTLNGHSTWAKFVDDQGGTISIYGDLVLVIW